MSNASDLARLATAFGTSNGGNLAILNTNASVSSSTGALTVGGGAGIAGNLNVGGTINYFAGNMGVGITAPTRKLQVLGTTGTIAGFSGTTHAVRLESDVTYGLTGAAISGADTTLFSTYQPLIMNGSQLGFAIQGVERMRMDSAGNVGIATTTVTTGFKLQVNGIVADQAGNLRDIPSNAQGGAYVLSLADNGEMVNISTGGVTVNSGIFSAGNNITIYNNSAVSQTITQGASVTMYLAGTATTGNRTLAQRGICTIVCVAANTFVISGAGLT